MAFTQTQIRKLAGKLPERFVKTRSERGMTLSYVEGWHVIDEANRVFGFDGWDRETVAAECVWQDVRISPKACSYAVRVRIKVRAGKVIVSREGTGIGHGTGATLGEAHESALKEAETDATKRALITFGNRFGLALYDKAQAGVERARTDATKSAPSAKPGDGDLPAAVATAPVAWSLLTVQAPPRLCETPQQFCSAAKEALRLAQSTAALEALWAANAPTVTQLRAVQPELRARNGAHYADLLEGLYRQQQKILQHQASQTATAATAADVSAPAVSAELSSEAPATEGPTEAAVSALAEAPADKSATAITMPRRIRDAAHLKHVASLPCLVCGRTPSHAHHLRFVQPRSLGSKPSDEWTVPLCPIHHRALHDVGREDEWWQAKNIDAKAEAERLWHATHPRAALTQNGESGHAEHRAPASLMERVANETGDSTAVSGDGQAQPLPINLHVARPPFD